MAPKFTENGQNYPYFSNDRIDTEQCIFHTIQGSFSICCNIEENNKKNYRFSRLFSYKTRAIFLKIEPSLPSKIVPVKKGYITRDL